MATTFTKETLDSRSVKELARMCKERNLSSTGIRAALINRLSNWNGDRSSSETGRSAKTKAIYCCVPDCTNNSQCNNILMHRIPAGRDRKAVRELWVTKLKAVRANLILSEGTRVCSAHFMLEDYKDGHLKPNSFPSLFPSQPKKPKTTRPNLLERLRLNVGAEAGEECCTEMQEEKNIPDNGTEEHMEICKKVDNDNVEIQSQSTQEADLYKTLNGQRRLWKGAKPTKFPWKEENPGRRPIKRHLVETYSDDPHEPDEVVSNEPQVTPCCSADHDYDVAPVNPEDLLLQSNKTTEGLELKVLKLESERFFLARFSNDPQSIRFYTGFKDYETLQAVYNTLAPTASFMVRWSQVQRNTRKELQGDVFQAEALTLFDQFFLFSCRIRQGFHEFDLAQRFHVSQSTVSHVLVSWTNYLYFMLGALPIWPPRSIIAKNMPEAFKISFPKTRVILDTTEIRVQTPSSKVVNYETYSNYESHNTFKCLVGISPFGAVTFVSSLFTGSISDEEITKRSGILDLLEADDEVMADKGFAISELLQDKKCTLTILPFLGQKGIFTKHEVIETQEIAHLRTLVERAIRRIKEYHIFDRVIPLTLAGTVNQLWTVCAILTNFKEPLFCEAF